MCSIFFLGFRFIPVIHSLISLIFLTFTHLLTHSFTFTIIYLSVHLLIFHSLINLHQVIKVRLHSYFHAYERHSLAKFLLLGNEVFFLSWNRLSFTSANFQLFL